MISSQVWFWRVINIRLVIPFGLCTADSSFVQVSAPQGLLEAHGLNLLVCGAGFVDCTFQVKKSSGSLNKSAGTSFSPVSAPQGLQEEHGLHLLVPGAGVVVGTSQPIKILHLGVPTDLLIPYSPL